MISCYGLPDSDLAGGRTGHQLLNEGVRSHLTVVLEGLLVVELARLGRCHLLSVYNSLVLSPLKL